MKTLNDILIIGALFSGITISNYAHGEKMQSATQDLVINKMERVLSTLEKSDPAWLSSQQRLADLLSERARTRFMLEVESQCDGCKGSKSDRKQAIDIYESLLREIKLTEEHGFILFQLAHLYQMADQNDKAILLYENIIRDAKKKNIPGAIVSRTHVELGDLLSQKGQAKEARAHYKTALNDKALENRAFTVYNLAWTEFNSDNLAGAISTLENLLKNPSQIKRDTDEGSSYDSAFHTDILRDLATFYTKKDITTREIDTFEQLAPENKRKDLLLSFSREADRIGQKKAAQEILNRYLSKYALTTNEQIESTIQLAQINYDRGQMKQSIAEFTKASVALQRNGCDDEKKCEEIQKNMKRYVTELHRSKKLQPDGDLLNAYVNYVRTYPKDAEMSKRGAQTAMELNNFPMAIEFYRTVSKNKDYSQKERHEACLNEISAAEKSKNPTLQREAYLHYLDFDDSGAKSFEVRYQLAYLNYQQKQFGKAAESFEDLAKDKKGPMDLRKKAADLSLDALVQLKNERVLEDLAWDYVEIFPQVKTEFKGIALKTLMNRVARTANNSHSTKSELKNALKSMDEDKISSANSNEKILFYTNRSVLAKRLEEDAVYVHSLNALINLPGLSKEKQQATLEQLTGYYEKKLDFKQAYLTALRLNAPQLSEKEKEFRLGTLADFAGLDAVKHYRRALDKGLNGERALNLRSRLVLISANPAKELKAQASELKRKPKLLNETVLLVYAKTGNSSALSSVLEMKEIRNQQAALFIKKQAFYSKVQAEKRTLAAHELNQKSERQLQQTIEQRMKLLTKADKLLAESLSLKDVTAQMLALNLISSENERMVKNLAVLPLPANLNAQERNQYLTLLKGQSKPILFKARTAGQKQQEIWNRSTALAQTIRDYKTARPELKALLSRELTLLHQLPGKGPMKDAVDEVLEEKTSSFKELLAARQSVSENPSSIREIENLKNLETKIGHPLMPAYLEARLSLLQRGKSL